MTTTLVKNGTIVTASDRYEADIYIDKGVITLIGRGPDDARPTPSSTRPASSCMPGGIDVHTHLDMPFGGTHVGRRLRDAAPSPPRTAARRRSSTSRSRTSAKGCTRRSRAG